MSENGLSWNMLQAIVGGLSAIDVPQLHLSNEEEAADFIASYGFDWRRARQRKEIETLRREAVRFIEEELLVDPERAEMGESDIAVRDAKGRALEIDPRIRAEKDVRQLLLMASFESDVRRTRDQQWACALLRVMHTLAHTRTYFNEQFGAQIRAQVLGRFTPHLFGSAANGDLRLGEGDEAIPLTRFEVKHTKPLHSVALKLLHKVENVASDVFDRVGVRFVTRERFDTLLVVHYLRVHHVVMFANIKPSRSRNTLIDIADLRSELDRLDTALDDGEIDHAERLARIRKWVREAPRPDADHAAVNPFSANDYRAIQFTCRQQIRIRDPYGHDLGGLTEEAAARLGDDDPLVQKLARRARMHDEIRFFFPFEIQVLDEEAYRESRDGRASYLEYKSRQRAAARSRVLGGLLEPAADSEPEILSLRSGGETPLQHLEPLEPAPEETASLVLSQAGDRATASTSEAS